MSVWITGDTHGDWINRLNVDSFPEQKEMTKDDYIIICGDLYIFIRLYSLFRRISILIFLFP